MCQNTCLHTCQNITANSYNGPIVGQRRRRRGIHSAGTHRYRHAYRHAHIVVCVLSCPRSTSVRSMRADMRHDMCANLRIDLCMNMYMNKCKNVATHCLTRPFKPATHVLLRRCGRTFSSSATRRATVPCTAVPHRSTSPQHGGIGVKRRSAVALVPARACSAAAVSVRASWHRSETSPVCWRV